MRLRVALALPAVLAATLAAGVTSASATPLVVLDRGHADVGVGYEDGALDVHVHDETAEHDPADVLLGVLPAARTTVPDDPAFGFLGNPGDPVWILPQTADPDLLFLGLGTDELEPGVFAGDSVTLRLLRVRGPGSFSLFTVDPFGAPQVLLNSRDGLPDRLSLPVATHSHANWAFRAPGTYRLTVQATATLAGGGTVRSEPVILTFRVH